MSLDDLNFEERETGHCAKTSAKRGYQVCRHRFATKMKERFC